MSTKRDLCAFIDKVEQRAFFKRSKDRSLRQGQALFNALYELDPLIADAIRGTDSDCFYQDSRIPAFWKAICGTVEINED